jgi:5-methylthioadenosine/S-adenosylhomocysteine deaminase
MENHKYTLCRARFLLPLAEPDRSLRIQDGYVLSEDEEIKEVGRYSEEIGKRIKASYGAALRVLGASGAAGDEIPCLNGVLMPSFVKAHGHDHEQPLIGIAKDEPLTAWLDHAVNPFTSFILKEYDRLCRELSDPPHLVTYRMARLCDIHYGITTCMVHHCNFNKYRLKEIATANESAGTTMIVAIGGQDRYYVKEVLDEPDAAVERLNEALKISGLKRTSFCPGPDQVFSNSRKMLVPLKAWAREHKTLFHIHSAEEPKTTQWFIREIEPGLTEVEFLEKIGILDASTVIAHQVNCGPRDVEILARTQTRIVHNPLANTILGSGMPPVIDMLEAGVPVAISTDGSGSADNQNIIAAARLASQYQKAKYQDATLLKSQQLLEMITSVPAKMLGKNQGELAPGRQADWIVLDLSRPNLVPTRLDNLMENIIWAADGGEVDTVVARGRLLKEKGRVLPFADGTTPAQIMGAVQKLSELFAEHQKTAPELHGTGAHQ